MLLCYPLYYAWILSGLCLSGFIREIYWEMNPDPPFMICCFSRFRGSQSTCCCCRSANLPICNWFRIMHFHYTQTKRAILPLMLGLQGLLKQTEADHPDYYLLLVCIQQLRSFTAQHHHLLQHNQELLLHNHKEVKRSALILLNKSNTSTLARDVECDWYRRSSIKHLLKTADNNISSPYHCSAPVLWVLPPSWAALFGRCIKWMWLINLVSTLQRSC